MSFRPKRGQQPDKNHKIVSNVLRDRCGGWRRDEYGVHHANLRGLRVVAYDMSKPGGELVDWLVMVSWFPVFFEVKREREVSDPSRLQLTEDQRLAKMLKPGEVEFLQTCPAVSMIVTTEDQVYVMLQKAADLVLLVEDTFQERSEFLRLFFPKLAKDLLIERIDECVQTN